ncbi:MAG TPA: penicillin acylase family protein, partial [Kofleriaceae bacterium]|nr:penicillin acylase family protein [Kofleriaceae bacterium]
MRAAVRTAVVAAFVVACGGDGDSGPYSGIAPSVTIDGHGLSAQVDMVRDGFGVPHIHARTMEDLAFAQGYVMAADRLPQMDLFRHFATGTIAELFGALDQDQIDTDLEMRLHRMKPLAEETWAALETSAEARDQEIAAFLLRFSDGVNQYLAELQRGQHVLDSAVGVWFDASRAAPWTPVDSLAIGRLQAWSLSYDESDVGDLAEWQRAFERFDGATDPALQARAGAAFDLLPFKPMDTTSTIRDFRTGSARRTDGRRPHVPEHLLQAALRTLEPKLLGTLRVRDPRNGSNNWVVGPGVTDGRTIMANDPHLQLSSPSIFYLVHLTVPDRLDVQGITFPGIPGVILGHNEHLAWGATTANHDVTDYYLEDIAPCTAGGGDCVTFQGAQVPIETWQETIQIGANGTITDSMTVTYERVPHHGPIVPSIVGHDLAPRAAGPALSVRYTGHEVTNELRAFHALWTARTVDEAKVAMQDFGFGAQNWVFADDQGNIGWSSHALVPKRSEGCFTFDPIDNPQGVAPWWVVPGDGSCEWQGYFAAENIPSASNPASGYLVTANADPIGATADGDPLNQPLVEGHLLYIGAKQYAQGWRAGRITRRIEAAAAATDHAITADDMAAIQGDAYS